MTRTRWHIHGVPCTRPVRRADNFITRPNVSRAARVWIITPAGSRGTRGRGLLGGRAMSTRPRARRTEGRRAAGVNSRFFRGGEGL